MEVVHHDLSLETDRMIVALDIVAEFLGSTPDIELWIGFDRLDELVIAIDRHVVLEHIEDKALLDGLLHCVAVEGSVFGLSITGDRLAENLQCLVLGSCCECVVAGIRQHLSSFHDAVDSILGRLVLPLGTNHRKGSTHGCGCLATLAGVCLIDQYRERTCPVLAADVLQNEGELLNRGDDDLLAALNELAEITRAFGVAHRRSDLGELLDRVLDLCIEDAPVGHNDDRVKDQ